MSSAVRKLFAAAAILALAASLFVFFFLGGTSITVTSEGTETMQHLSWFESQGWWGIAILFIFAALYYGPLHFYKRGKNGMAILFAIAAIGLSILAGFSIGLFFMPAALFLLLALIYLFVSLSPRQQNRAP